MSAASYMSKGLKVIGLKKSILMQFTQSAILFQPLLLPGLFPKYLVYTSVTVHQKNIL